MRKMKDCGLDIVGQMPTEWDFIRLRYLCDITTGDSDTQDADPDGEYPFYVRSPIVERSTKFTFNGEGILMAGDGAGAGRVFHHAFGKYAVHQRVYRLYNFKVNSNFLFYYISNLFPSVMDKGSAQSTVPSVRLPMLLNFEVCFPPIAEQQKIADFLDEKCDEIDSVRSDVQREIEILNDYKKSVITEAVTKGLNPKAKLKDSGLDIIGQMPTEWDFIRLRYLCDITTGDSDTQDADLDGEYPFYVRSPIVERSTKFTFNGEGILMAGDGAGAGRVFHHAFGKYAVHQRVYRLYNFKVNSNYLFYYISNLFPSVMDKGSAQSTVPSVRLPMLLNFEVCFPPLSEQKAIADYLDEKCSEIDATIADKQKQLETLDEYKKSLIFEYVTGKKEVS